MVGELSPLTLDEATELAGCLMTASTIERYSHALQNSRAARRLLSSLRTGTTDGTDLLRQGWRSRERVYQAPSRSEWELPLAAIISVLGQSGVSGTEDLLMAMATSHSPQSAWLSGLSRRILAHRTSSSIDASPLVARLPALADVRFDTESDLMLAQTRPRPASPFPQTQPASEPPRCRASTSWACAWSRSSTSDQTT